MVRGSCRAEAAVAEGGRRCSTRWPARSRRHRPALPAPGLGRAAAAGDGRDGADDRPGAGGAGRADHGARRHHAGGGAARVPRGRCGTAARRRSTCRTTWPWWRRWRTGSSCCAAAACRKAGAPALSWRAGQRLYAQPAGCRADALHRVPASRRRRASGVPSARCWRRPACPRELWRARTACRCCATWPAAAARRRAGRDRRIRLGQEHAGAGADGVAAGPSAGEVRLGGEVLPAAVPRRTRDQLRRMQIVFQSADTAHEPGASASERLLARPLPSSTAWTGEAPGSGGWRSCWTWCGCRRTWRHQLPAGPVGRTEAAREPGPRAGRRAAGAGSATR